MIKLEQGDCLELIKQLEDNSVDLIVTDPPYKVISGGNKSEKWKSGYANSVFLNTILRWTNGKTK